VPPHMRADATIGPIADDQTPHVSTHSRPERGPGCLPHRPRHLGAGRPSGHVALVAAELAAAAVIVAAWSLIGVAPSTAELGPAAVLAALGIVTTEITQHGRQTRRHALAGRPADLTAVWAFAAALLLHPLLIASVAVAVHSHFRWRTHRLTLALPEPATILCCLAAHAVHTALAPVGCPPAAGAGVAVLCFAATHRVLTFARCVVAQPSGPAAANDAGLATATAGLGALTAAALTIHPALALFTLPSVLCLHRAVLARHLTDAAALDPKTGLLNAATWHHRAQHALNNPTGGPSAVLILDLDHFKTVNDTHGHIAGDHVLTAVAEILRAEVRNHDLVGRFGGDEFVVLLTGRADSDHPDAHAVADRIRRRIAEMRVEIAHPDKTLGITGLRVSIGVALHPIHGTDLPTLLRTADTALYDAKRAGRNTARTGLSAVPHPRRQPTPRAAPDTPEGPQPVERRTALDQPDTR
jgi:diguanylate cyclase (GGDEF)-like protein